MKQVDSTNEEAKRLIQMGAPCGTVIHADEQTAGRGRLSHAWWSPLGNLYISIIISFDDIGRPITDFAFVSAVAVANCIDLILPSYNITTLKWPNDILINGAKIAGILIEQVENFVVIGIGININHAPEIAAYRATSVVERGGAISINAVRDVLLIQLRKNMFLWRRHGFDAIRRAWLSKSYPVGTPMQVFVGSQSFAGKFAGLDLEGGLLLQTPSNIKRIVFGSIIINFDNEEKYDEAFNNI